MKKWLFIICVIILIVMGVLASALGLDPTFGMNDGYLFSFASGVNSIGRIIAIFSIAALLVIAVIVAIAAIADFLIQKRLIDTIPLGILNKKINYQAHQKYNREYIHRQPVVVIYSPTGQ